MQGMNGCSRFFQLAAGTTDGVHRGLNTASDLMCGFIRTHDRFGCLTGIFRYLKYRGFQLLHGF